MTCLKVPHFVPKKGLVRVLRVLFVSLVPLHIHQNKDRLIAGAAFAYTAIGF